MEEQQPLTTWQLAKTEDKKKKKIDLDKP